MFLAWAGVGHTLPAKIYFATAATGWVGVTLFFALSGFLITGILLDTRDRPHAWRTFTVRRALRIFPLYYVALATAFLVLAPVGALPAWLLPDESHQVWYWTYLVNWSEPFGLGGPGFGHFWSLAVEEQFYLLWPLVALSLGSRRLAAVSAILVAVALGARVAILEGPWTADVASSAIYRFTICRWDALALGAIVAICARDAQWAPRLIRIAWPGTLVLLACALALGAWRHGFGSGDWVMETIGQLVFAGYFCRTGCARRVAGHGRPGFIPAGARSSGTARGGEVQLCHLRNSLPSDTRDRRGRCRKKSLRRGAWPPWGCSARRSLLCSRYPARPRWFPGGCSKTRCYPCDATLTDDMAWPAAAATRRDGGPRRSGADTGPGSRMAQPVGHVAAIR